MGAISPLTRRASWRSPAKVNLCLRVVGRRDDGYHLLDSIFVPVDLCDDLAMRVDDVAPGGDVRITVRCDRADVPSDDRNLAARAAQSLLEARRLGATIHLDIAKRIPPGSGLGGGSGNAATVLRELDAMLAPSTSHAVLAELAVRLGADVPFFLTGAPARVRGIGEDVQPIERFGALALVVAIPPVAVSTASAFRAYAALVADPKPGGAEPSRLAAGTPPSQDLFVNDLERVVLPAFPAIAELKRRLLDAGAAAAVMSGSGSAVVALARSREDAEEMAAAVRSPDVAAYAVHSFGVVPHGG